MILFSRVGGHGMLPAGGPGPGVDLGVPLPDGAFEVAAEKR